MEIVQMKLFEDINRERLEEKINIFLKAYNLNKEELIIAKTKIFMDGGIKHTRLYLTEIYYRKEKG